MSPRRPITKRTRELAAAALYQQVARTNAVLHDAVWSGASGRSLSWYFVWRKEELAALRELDPYMAEMAASARQ